MNKYLLRLKNNTVFGFKLLLYLLHHPKHWSIALQNLPQVKNITLNHEIPWLTYEAIDWLKQNLNKDSLVFEWGSGGSTIFLAKRVGQVISIEHHPDWHQKVKNILIGKNISNTETYLIEPINQTNYTSYAAAINKYPDNHFDIILVDGQARNECTVAGQSKLKKGGALILDNAERLEYNIGKNNLAGWPVITHYGPGAYNRYFWQTSVYIKP